ncbi:MAG: FAD-binding oxidoreductase [Myxococcota bacterium]
MSCVLYPDSVGAVEALFRERERPFRTLGLCGAGRSYGDASINDGGALLDLSRLRSISEWDPDSGRVRVEPGVTIEQLWRKVLPDGFWPPVVPGTMFVTLGGAVSMNIHGKNCFSVGPIGDQVESLELVLPTGETVECGPDRRPELFRGVVGGFGMLGCITGITLRLKKIHSGRLRVRAFPARSLEHMVSLVEENSEADYLVGWCDGLAADSVVGRGVLHRADYPAKGEDPDAESSLQPGRQDLPPRILGVVPREWVWFFVRLGLHRPGLHVFNRLKVWSDRLGSTGPHLWPLAQFHFLLDYVPGWIRAYGSSGLIQIQPFLPAPVAVDIMVEILRLTKRRGFPPYLIVFKKHRADRFLLSHGLDGYSLAMDFPVRRRRELWSLAREIQRMTVEAGGRFYFAKDSTLAPAHVRGSYPEADLRAFLELKRKCDPESVLQTDLARRVWPELCARSDSPDGSPDPLDPSRA